jgi:hypothetical protein
VTRTRRSTHRRAVTLVEVLVTIGVTVILTLILITGLRAVRGQTLAMKDLQNIRLSGQDFLAWSAENDERFVNIGPEYPGQWEAVLGPSMPPLSPDGFASFYWGQQVSWNSVLNALTGAAHQHWQSVYGPRDLTSLGAAGESVAGPSVPERGTIQYALSATRFVYSPTFLTHASAWEGDIEFPRVTDIAPFFATVRLSQVKSPGGKGLLLNKLIPDHSNTFHVVYVDGSADRRDRDTFVPAASPPTAVDPSLPGTPVLHTLRGYEGRDR